MSIQDDASFEAVVGRIHDMWDALLDLDPSDDSLTLDQRMGAGDCARVMADLDVFDLLPTGWTRMQLLERAREFLPVELTEYPRDDRLGIEVSYVWAVAEAGELDTALLMIQETCAEYSDLPQLLIELRAFEANLLQILGRYEEALDASLAARELHESLPPEEDAPGYAELSYRVAEGMILTNLGLPDRAQVLLRECQALLSRPGAEAAEWMVEDLAVQLALARDDFEWVVQTLERRLGAMAQAMSDAEVNELRVRISSARASQARIERDKEAMQSARMELSALLGDEPLQAIGVLDGPLALAELELALGDTDAARERLVRLERDLDELIPTSARMPRQSVFELQGRVALADPESSVELPELLTKLEVGFRDMLRAWGTAPPREGGVGFLLFDSRRSHLVTLIRVCVAIDPGPTGANQALSYLLEAEAMSTLATTLGASGVDANEIRSTLVPPGGGVLAYVGAPHTSIVFALTEDRTRVFESTDLHSLRRAAARWRATLAEGGGDTSEVALDSSEVDLIEGLLPGTLAAEAMRWSSLTISGFESIGSVSFESLRVGGIEQGPLGMLLPTSYLPSLRVGHALISSRSPSPPEQGDAAVAFALGGSTPLVRAGETLPALPWATEDLESLCSTWNEASVVLRDEPDEARRLMLEAGEAGVQLLVVVAHGANSPERERGSGVAFGEGSEVFPDDFDVRRAPPIVLLGVCDAGRGVQRGGDDGISHLGGALLAAGSRTVLVSHEDLSFEATVTLASIFQRELGTGASPALALQRARVEIARRSGWDAPRFHSLLHVYGDGHTPAARSLIDAVAPEAKPWSRYALLAILLPVAYLVVRSRRRRAA